MFAILRNLPFDLRLDCLDIVRTDAPRRFESKSATVFQSFNHSAPLSKYECCPRAFARPGHPQLRRNYSLGGEFSTSNGACLVY